MPAPKKPPHARPLSRGRVSVTHDVVDVPWQEGTRTFRATVDMDVSKRTLGSEDLRRLVTDAAAKEQTPEGIVVRALDAIDDALDPDELTVSATFLVDRGTVTVSASKEHSE